jgi:hypothetical protein
MLNFGAPMIRDSPDEEGSVARVGLAEEHRHAAELDAVEHLVLMTGWELLHQTTGFCRKRAADRVDQ